MSTGTQSRFIDPAAQAAHDQLIGERVNRLGGPSRSQATMIPVNSADAQKQVEQRAAGSQVAFGDYPEVTEAIRAEALTAAIQAPDRIFEAQKSLLNLDAQYDRRKAIVAYTAHQSGEHKNADAAKAAVAYALATDEELRIIEAGLNVAKARYEKEKNGLEASRAILRTFSIVL